LTSLISGQTYINGAEYGYFKVDVQGKCGRCSREEVKFCIWALVTALVQV